MSLETMLISYPYSLERLIHFLQALKEAKQPALMKNLKYIKKEESANFFTVRCDIERQLTHTLSFAEELSKAGVPATFYFHTRIDCYNPSIFEKIKFLGHEIGYHYECLDRKQGNFPEAAKLLKAEIEKFRNDGFLLETICAHGEAGLIKTGYKYNYDLFLKYPEILSEYNIEEAYLDIKAKLSPYYISDVYTSYNRFWKSLESIKQKNHFTQIVLHPHRWHNNPVLVGREILRDLIQLSSNKILGKRSYKAI